MKNTAKRLSRIAAIGLIAGTTLLPITTVWADETTQTTAVTTVATDAAAQAAPTPPPLPATAEKVHNPYGLEALWREGDLVAKSTLFILVLMSIGTWYIILSKVFQQSKIKRHGTEAERHFWEAESLNSAAESLNTDSSYRYIAEKGIRSTKHHDGTLLERIDFNTWVTISIQRAIEKVQSHLSNGLAFLATVGSTAPFVGLFGTVWGIYHALTAIGISGQASIDKVAGPVGEALIMTAIGLAVAVPAVLGYNWLTRRNKAVMDNVRSFGSDLHAVLLSGDLNSNHPNRDSK
ncbi:MotA/TolQ/ExbB proton channel family protein [Acinetobacter genomosp. 15BJ]|uniref:Biopolymer transport protein ExbB n=1 Tax=Acinetobacter genomosp. 15BJ TaxID=106651 RepID=R9ATS7_9GAMM|nr:MotA/TolQ/ExbB proton channel family protein [Acinetobacter genomosp. 15BJ]EOR05593.1 biopolymer transporter ExbB [Acinetobacter genomosp. 15BJ]MCH7290932.1 MotA/TolQ/ExbB proton channel family protein [Acinetobacter genomosp. 15BJ]MDO3655902.1 MotA/TolQ/ExbB proton channel family protein [Acinetobacter genomosp. 15BJ]